MESRDELFEAVCESLNKLPPLSDDLFTGGKGETPWKIGFTLVRWILKVLFDHHIDPDEFCSTDFHDVVCEWLYGVVDPKDIDGVILDFDRNWYSVELPEDEDPATYNWMLTVRSTERLDVDESRYTKPSQIENAQLIVTFFANLQDWHQPDETVPFCAISKLAKMMGKSPHYVHEIVTRLKGEGALVPHAKSKVRPGKAARYLVVVEPDERVANHNGNGRSRRSEGSERQRRERGSEKVVVDARTKPQNASSQKSENADRPVAELKNIVPRVVLPGTMTSPERARSDFVKRMMTFGDGAEYRAWWEEVWNRFAPYDDCVRAVYEALTTAENSLDHRRAQMTGSESINSPARFVASVAHHTLKKHDKSLPKRPAASIPTPTASARAHDP